MPTFPMRPCAGMVRVCANIVLKPHTVMELHLREQLVGVAVPSKRKKTPPQPPTSEERTRRPGGVRKTYILHCRLKAKTKNEDSQSLQL